MPAHKKRSHKALGSTVLGSTVLGAVKVCKLAGRGAKKKLVCRSIKPDSRLGSTVLGAKPRRRMSAHAEIDLPFRMREQDAAAYLAAKEEADRLNRELRSRGYSRLVGGNSAPAARHLIKRIKEAQAAMQKAFDRLNRYASKHARTSAAEYD